MKVQTIKTLTVIILMFCGVVLACNRNTYSPPVKTEAQKKKDEELAAENKRKDEGRKAFEDDKAKYTAIPQKEQLAKQPTILRNGGILYYDFSDGRWGTANYLKSSEKNSYNSNDDDSKAHDDLKYRFASTPDEVKVIALKYGCENVRAGSYGSTPAYVEKCVVVLIDPAIPAVVYRRAFQGNLEDYKTIDKNTSSVIGYIKATDIARFLRGLDLPPETKTAKK